MPHGFGMGQSNSVETDLVQQQSPHVQRDELALEFRI